MGNKPQKREENRGKVTTKYDRKIEARKKQAENERKNRLLSLLTVMVVCVCIIGVILFSAISSAINKRAVINDTYIKVGEHKVTQLEYEYHYNYSVNSYLNYMQSIGFLSYIGLDTSKDFSKQQYSSTMTWKDYFDQMAVDQIQRLKALMDDANSAGFVYDANDDYTGYKADMRDDAKEAEYSINNYYKAMFGSYATEKNVKPFVMDGYVASAYEAELLEKNKPADDKITEYYEENKADYDMVDYRSFTFTAEIEDDATQEEIETAMAVQKVKAETMISERKAGADFESLCLQYASESDKEYYEDEEEEYSLTESATKSSIPEYYSDWLYEENRAAGDITLIEDAENNVYYIVEFVQRVYDEDCKNKISEKLAYEWLNEHLDTLLVNYEVTDVKGELVFLTIKPEEEEDIGEGEDIGDGVE